MFKSNVENSQDLAEAVSFLGKDDDYKKVRRRNAKYANSLKQSNRFMVQCDLLNTCIFGCLTLVLIGALDIMEFTDFPSATQCKKNIRDYDNLNGLPEDHGVLYEEELERKCQTLVEGFPWPITSFFLLSVGSGTLLALAAILENRFLGLVCFVMLGFNFLMFLVQFIILNLIAPGRDLMFWNVVADRNMAVSLERIKLSVCFIFVFVAHAYVGYFAWSSYKIIKPGKPLLASVGELIRSIFYSITCEYEEQCPNKHLTKRAQEHEMMSK
ncbi:unnamed protein product [Allacma fusca]|uniref:Uncharacterized protein n=1 Tax=Allacma fusca TaxID=39272 RepID=A0A8J2LJ14_9HEXA|nr:unnamed protein product [Allacma fusca]